MGRDLLGGRQVIYVPEDEEEGSVKKSSKAKQVDLKQKVNELTKSSGAALQKSDVGRAKSTEKAFKAAYFNKDTSGVKTVNQRSSNMQALRGDDGATDLRRIVLPRSTTGIETPLPEDLQNAAALMKLEDFDLNFENLLGRQGEWLQGEGVTPEMILARLKKFEEMVETRKIALARIKGLKNLEKVFSVTIGKAMASQSTPKDSPDLAGEGTELIRDTADQADGMHRRMAKTLGIKIK
jgi:hypothetical protein